MVHLIEEDDEVEEGKKVESDMERFLIQLLRIKLINKVTEDAITAVLLLLRSELCVWIPELKRCDFPPSYTELLTELKLRTIRQEADIFPMCTNGCKVFKDAEGAPAIIVKDQRCDDCEGILCRDTLVNKIHLPRAV